MHCPSCQKGKLRMLKVEKSETGRKQYTLNGKLYATEGTIMVKTDEIVVGCECGHYHVMKKENYINPIRKPNKIRIKRYGIHHY